MKVWITRYALTSGIFEAEAEISEFGGARIKSDSVNFFSRAYVHRTRSEAVTHAEFLRKQAINSLQRRIDKLRGLRFE